MAPALGAAVLLHVSAAAFAGTVGFAPHRAADPAEPFIRVTMLPEEAMGDLEIGEGRVARNLSPKRATADPRRPTAEEAVPPEPIPLDSVEPARISDEPAPLQAEPALAAAMPAPIVAAFSPAPSDPTSNASAGPAALSGKPTVPAAGAGGGGEAVAAIAATSNGGEGGQGGEDGAARLRAAYLDYKARLGQVIEEAMDRRFQREAVRRDEGSVAFRVEVRSNGAVWITELSGESALLERVAREALSAVAAPAPPSLLPDPVAFRYRARFRLRVL